MQSEQMQGNVRVSGLLSRELHMRKEHTGIQCIASYKRFKQSVCTSSAVPRVGDVVGKDVGDNACIGACVTGIANAQLTHGILMHRKL